MTGCNCWVRPPRLLRRFIFLCRTQLKRRANELIYRIAGLPTAIRFHRRIDSNPAAAVRRAYARWYWQPGSPGECLDLLLALLLWPIAFLVLAALFLWRSSPSRSISCEIGRPRWHCDGWGL